MLYVFLVTCAFGGLAAMVWTWSDRGDILSSFVALVSLITATTALRFADYPDPTVDEACIASVAAVLSVVGFIDVRMRTKARKGVRLPQTDYRSWM